MLSPYPPPQHPPELPFPLNICEFKYGRWFGSAVFLRLRLKLGPGDPVRSGPAVPSQTLSKYHMIGPPPPRAPAPGNGGLERNTATTLELPPPPHRPDCARGGGKKPRLNYRPHRSQEMRSGPGHFLGGGGGQALPRCPHRADGGQCAVFGPDYRRVPETVFIEPPRRPRP